MGLANIGPELLMGMASLFAHKLRSLLTMLGMIFGVGAVVAMLSITAGAQKEMMSFIDQLGVNNIIIEAHEAVDRNELQTVRAVSPGLSFRDYRAISENVPGLVAITPRKRFKPQKLLPKTSQEQPQLIGVLPNYMEINSLKLVAGRFFTEEENKASAPVCVLGETTKVNLLGYDNAVGKYVKVNDTWLQVIGVLAEQATADSDVEGLEVAERIRRAVETTVWRWSGSAYPLMASCGVAGYPDSVGDVNNLRSAADAALYRAKEAGRNRVEKAAGGG